MTNFVFISPNFPEKYWQFCDELQKNGVRVLGIGDARKEELSPELRHSITEYYHVDSMADYDQMYRAVGYYAWKYGHIDWIESNNEFWLETDARLRTDFNVCTGVKLDAIEAFKEKSEMKKYYAKGGIRTARQIKAVEGLDAAKRFSVDAGYPLFAKPDVGVGAGGAHKIEDEVQLEDFFRDTPQLENYVIEEFVTGDICTYDAIINSHGEPLVESMCVCPPSIADIVNFNLDSTYYVEKAMSENLRFWGRRTVDAFGVKSRFVHLEFFRLNKAHRGLGEVGDFVALEVNMRPGGGYTPDMINYAHNISMFKIWADMIAFDRRTTPDPHDDYYCVFAGRRDNVGYVIDHNAILSKYASAMMMSPRIDKALSGAMGDHAYIARFRTEQERDAFLADVCMRR
ncbi:MAG: hypothetical protein PUD94_09030 [Prevotellaceae bacterium]|nr:hypothetical protein [Prevotellaceae bacterium]